LLLPLLRGFTPASRTEHIIKYSSIENFINYLSNGYSFVLIGVRMRELWLFHFSTTCCPEFHHVQPSVIRPYPLVGTSDCLAAWFVGTYTSWSFWNLIISNCFFLRLCKVSWWHHYPFCPSIQRCTCGLHLEVF
jgi:hypothetical protein